MMPKILEMWSRDDDTLWVRIPTTLLDTPITLWTKAEKEEAFKREREKCIRAIEKLGL